MTTKLSTEITNFEATPQVYNSTVNSGGRLRVAQGTVALATTDLDIGDIVHLAVLPAEASVVSIRLASDDLDSNGTPLLTWDVGVYTTAKVASDIDAFASAITLGQAATVFTEYAFEARVIEECGQKLYLDAAATLASHDNQYYISLTCFAAAATAAAGDISYNIEYVVD